MKSPLDPHVHLASASPRRRDLLAQLGLRWVLVPAVVDESRHPGEPAADYVRRLALAKARVAHGQLPPAASAPVIAADTTVVVGDEVLGKPAGEADALRMLRLLSGRAHQVFSAVAVVSARGESVAVSASQVVFRTIGEAEAAAYWRSGEPADKAGSYAIQGLGAIFVRKLSGSYSGVMGLPLFETARLLADHGVRVLGGEAAA
ncbi:MAG: septum formation inhibitor Maf [Gammaproteobacteria bacterium]|nr:septum formation inhibitor Maf [Gammaproteobacteria bacterium]